VALLRAVRSRGGQDRRPRSPTCRHRGRVVGTRPSRDAGAHTGAQGAASVAGGPAGSGRCVHGANGDRRDDGRRWSPEVEGLTGATFRRCGGSWRPAR
jgi:hypothetical protein